MVYIILARTKKFPHSKKELLVMGEEQFLCTKGQFLWGYMQVSFQYLSVCEKVQDNPLKVWGERCLVMFILSCSVLAVGKSPLVKQGDTRSWILPHILRVISHQPSWQEVTHLPMKYTSDDTLQCLMSPTNSHLAHTQVPLCTYLPSHSCLSWFTPTKHSWRENSTWWEWGWCSQTVKQ